MEQDGKHVKFNAKTCFGIIGDFILLGILSVSLGIVFGLALTYCLKKFRFVSHSSIAETFVIICFTMLCYYVSEILKQSEITSLVTCAMVLGHYAWYNLSPQGKHVTSVSIQTLGYAAEAFVFVFLGLSVMFYSVYPSSWQFVLAEFFIVIIGRTLAIWASYYTFSKCKGDKTNKLTLRELTFVSYAALIRGSVAFGLCEKLSDEFP